MNEKSIPLVLKICNICVFIFDCIINITTGPFILAFVFGFTGLGTIITFLCFSILIIVITSIVGLIYGNKNKINKFKFFYIMYITKIIIGHPLLIFWIITLFSDF